MNGQSMDATLHQVAGCIVHQTMTGECVFSGKNRSQYVDAEVTAFARAGVAGMAMRFVFNMQHLGIEDGEALTQQGQGFFVHHAGRTFLNGLTVTFSYTPAAM